MRQRTTTKLAARGADAMRAGANGLLDAARKSLWPGRRPQTAARVCIYRIGNIGDVVCALPAIYSIRRAYPAARLTLLTSPGRRGAAGAQELLDGARWLDEVLVYHSEDIADTSNRWTLLRRLRERAFDVWIELPPVKARLHTHFRNMLAARMAGARWGGGWELGPLKIATRAQSSVIGFPNEVERLLALVARLGIEPGRAEFPLPIGQAARDRALRILNDATIARRRLVALAPASKCEANLWPAARFAAVARHLIAHGFAVIVLGGASDRALCDEVAQGTDGAVSLAGQTSIPETCALLERCELAICVDSGVQHLAAALGVRCLSLFSGRDFPGLWSPHGQNHTILRKWTECGVCMLPRCPYENRCMQLIETSEVVFHADRMLSGRAARGIEAVAAPMAAHSPL